MDIFICKKCGQQTPGDYGSSGECFDCMGVNTPPQPEADRPKQIPAVVRSLQAKKNITREDLQNQFVNSFSNEFDVEPYSYVGNNIIVHPDYAEWLENKLLDLLNSEPAN